MLSAQRTRLHARGQPGTRQSEGHRTLLLKGIDNRLQNNFQIPPGAVGGLEQMFLPGEVDDGKLRCRVDLEWSTPVVRPRSPGE